MLSNGIDSFAADYCELEACDEHCLNAFFDAKDAILNVFKKHPELQNDPYQESIYGFPKRPALENPIFKVTRENNLEIFGPSLAKLSLWSDVGEVMGELEEEIDEAVFSQSYALIDMACYLVFLLNIYVPNRGLMQNLISTHTKVDALGRENYGAADVAIEKIVIKSIGRPSFNPSNRAMHLRVIAKRDATRSLFSPTQNRGIQFEKDCENALISSSFEVQTTPISGDYGADIIASKDGIGFAIQCKDTTKPVGVKAIQEAVAARSHYQVDFGVVCASAGFTEAAVELATSNKVILCDLDQLVIRLAAY